MLGPPYPTTIRRTLLHTGDRPRSRVPPEDTLIGAGSFAPGGGGEYWPSEDAGRAGGGGAGRGHPDPGESAPAGFTNSQDPQTGEKGSFTPIKNTWKYRGIYLQVLHGHFKSCIIDLGLNGEFW